jgi:hypothetical protein
MIYGETFVQAFLLGVKYIFSLLQFFDFFCLLYVNML